ncbi:Nucleotidylyl transferase, partial [Auricularia subglabra TFB-10046 SS5]
LRMCDLAAEHDSSWLMVDPWEATHPDYKHTHIVLDQFHHELNSAGFARPTVCRLPLPHRPTYADGPVIARAGRQNQVRLLLLAGSYLIATMSEPGVSMLLDHILARHGTLIVERSGSDVGTALDSLHHWHHNIHAIQQTIQYDVSSTSVRLYLRCRMSVGYLIPACVFDYIGQHGLYIDDPGQVRRVHLALLSA